MGAVIEESSAKGPSAADLCADGSAVPGVGTPSRRDVLLARRVAPMVALALLALAGCARGPTQELAGQWVGRPDTAAVRAARNAERFGAVDPPAGEAASGAAAEPLPAGSQPTSTSGAEAAGASGSGGVGGPAASSPGMRPAAPTDWQQYDVEVRLRFDPRGAASLQLDEGPAVVAQWQIVEAGPAGWVLELATPTSGQDAAGAVVRRRFELLTDRRGSELVGFTLTEVGADRQLGSLYFKRAE